MFRYVFIPIVLLLAGIQAAHGAATLGTLAQVNFTARTEGTIIAESEEPPGFLAGPEGTPFTLELTSQFSAATPWTNWPDGIATDTAQSSAVLTIGGERFEFSGTSRMELRVSLEPGDPYLRLWYFVAMDLPGTQDRIGFGSSMFMAPPSMPVSLLDLFASAEPYSPLNQTPSVGALYLFPHDEVGSRYVMGPLHAISYSTAGMPLPPAVPEPSTAFMLLAGLALTGAAARFKRTRRQPA